MQKLRENHQKVWYINCPIDVNMTKCSCCCRRRRCRYRCCRRRRRRHHHRSHCHLIRRHHIWATKIAPALMYESWCCCCCYYYWSYVKCFRSNRLFKYFLVFSFTFLLLRLSFFLLSLLHLSHSLLFSSMLFTLPLLTWQIAIHTHITNEWTNERTNRRKSLRSQWLNIKMK